MQFITDVADEAWQGTRVLVRIDVNVSVLNGRVIDTFRVRRAAETLRYLSERGARVVAVSHVGRDGDSLAPIAEALREYVPLTFVPDTVGTHARAAASALGPGEVLLLENIRREIGEMKNDADLARLLASFGEVYVNDAFAVSHRKHASVVGVPSLLTSYAGLVVQEETENLLRALKPEQPSLCILGGAKFETKEPLIEKLLDVYEHIFVGGALANDIFRARGLAVGRSLVSDSPVTSDVLLNQKILAPVDVTVERPDGQVRVCKDTDVAVDEKIVDIGPRSLELLLPYVQSATFILWNGPMGLYERGYTEWTERTAEAIATSDAVSIVGGGDTIASITSRALEEQFTFLSTGGGAMLEFLLQGTLPGLDALE